MPSGRLILRLNLLAFLLDESVEIGLGLVDIPDRQQENVLAIGRVTRRPAFPELRYVFDDPAPAFRAVAFLYRLPRTCPVGVAVLLKVLPS